MINNDDFGKPVTSTHILNKSWRGDGNRTWDKVPAKVCGLFIGIRYLQTGHMDQEFGEYGEPFGGKYWVETGTRIKAALIVESAKKNPIYAPAECVELAIKAGMIES